MPLLAHREETGRRQCGSCALCCKVMGVPEVKVDHAWCPHAKPGSVSGGCGIYPRRPERCRDFHCMWLLDRRLGEHWYPARAKIVVNASSDHGRKYVTFIVDPAYPGRWREEPWFSDIKTIAKAGLEGRLDQRWTTVLMIKDEKIPIIGSERLLRVAG